MAAKRYTSPSVFGLPFRPYVFPAAQAVLFLRWQVNVIGDIVASESCFDMSTQFCQQNLSGVGLVLQLLDPDNNDLNISQASAMQVKIQYPDGTTVDKAASFYTNGNDGIILYILLPGDLTQVGLYHVQAKVTLLGAILYSHVVPLQVFQNVDSD
jgi:hypothetical protein